MKHIDEYTDKELLTRFPILDMMEELKLNKVSKSRRDEIVRKYKKVLNDNEYYCISPMNPIKKKLLNTYKSDRSNGNGVVVKNFKFGYYGSTLALCKGTVNFNGNDINVIMQVLGDIKTSYEFHHYDEYIALYFSKKDIDKVCEGLA
jgi:hypothetical protein